jgi:hypothetical protein
MWTERNNRRQEETVMEKERTEQGHDADALVQLAEVINAKGDAGEIKEILKRTDAARE